MTASITSRSLRLPATMMLLVRSSTLMRRSMSVGASEA